MLRTVALLALVSSPAHAATLRMADLIQVDELGYSCVNEIDLERAYAAGGKSAGVPQTCLPRPCDALLDRATFDNEIIGRPSSDLVWDTYVGRYADHCVAETTPFGVPDVPIAPGGFWTPFVDPPVTVWAYLPPSTVFVPGTPSVGTPVTPFTPTGTLPPADPLPPVTPWTPADPMDPVVPLVPVEPLPPIVPLPASAVLLLSAVAGLMFLRRS